MPLYIDLPEFRELNKELEQEFSDLYEQTEDATYLHPAILRLETLITKCCDALIDR